MKRVLPLVLFLGGSLLLIFGLGSLGASFLVRGEGLPEGFTWKAPVDQVHASELAPSTVLLPLTGIPTADALNTALDGGHWENAFALIAYDTTLADPTRIGTLLQLGTRYAAGKDKVRAAWCFLDAARIATISPVLTDAVREDTLLQAAAGLRSISALNAARLTTDQAYLVAQYSPTLRRDQQARRLGQVANAYSALGAETLADQARAKSIEPIAAATDDAGYLPRETFVVKVVTPPESAEVNRAMQSRIAAAKLMQDDIQDILPNHPSDWPQDSLTQLRDTLVQEDKVRLTYLDQQLVLAKEPAVQIGLLRAKVDWLAYKTRIARGAFGANLVPDWTKNATTISDTWSDAWGELLGTYAAQAAAIPNAQAVSQASEDVTRQELLAVRWGWYRGVSDGEIHTRLSDLTGQLHDAAIPSLRLDLLVVGGKRTDFLLPDELYGKNDQALPR